MLHPLASLWRHPLRVSFYESETLAGMGLTQHHGNDVRRRFSSTDEAFQYLRCWAGEPDARAILKWILQRSGASQVSTYVGDNGWLWTLAGRMATGAVVVVEEHRRVGRPGRLVAPLSTDSDTDAIANLPLLSAFSPSSSAAPARVADTSTEDHAVNAEIASPMTSTVSESPESIADQIAQAQVLEEAASQGTPFCEICEKARKENHAAPPSAAREQPNFDQGQVQQARTLEQAAQQGTPFCEICERESARRAAGATA